MITSKHTFNKFHHIQESWIRRQINNLKYDSFIDFNLAKKNIEDAGITAFANNLAIDKFRNEYLSTIGKKKLSSALRTYKKRESRALTTKRLDVEISLKSYIALESLVNESKLTKIQIIEKLLLEEKEKKSRDIVTTTE